MSIRKKWGGRRDSNPRPSEPQSDILTRLNYAHHIRFSDELPPHTHALAGGSPPGERCVHGASAGIRTLDLRLRRPLLYPAELQAHTRPAWPCRNRAKSHTADINVFYQKDIMLSRAKRGESRIICRVVFLTIAGMDCIIDPISAVSGRAAQPCPQKRAAGLG